MKIIASLIIAAGLFVGGISSATAATVHRTHYMIVYRWNTHDPRVTWQKVSWEILLNRHKAEDQFENAAEDSIDPGKGYHEFESIVLVKVNPDGSSRKLEGIYY